MLEISERSARLRAVHGDSPISKTFLQLAELFRVLRGKVVLLANITGQVKEATFLRGVHPLPVADPRRFVAAAKNV